LHRAERAEIAMRVEELLDQRAASRPDELVLQVGVADVKARAGQAAACAW